MQKSGADWRPNFATFVDSVESQNFPLAGDRRGGGKIISFIILLELEMKVTTIEKTHFLHCVYEKQSKCSPGTQTYLGTKINRENVFWDETGEQKLFGGQSGKRILGRKPVN